jgi:S-DNA-T family DNA segregation ATPase FtsK/SpoIIIE
VAEPTGGELVPLHAVPDEADVAVPDAPAPEAAAPRPVVYDITSIGERRPVVPVPLRPENLRGTVQQFAGLQWYRGRYHGLRLPLYVVAVLFWGVAGLVQLAARQVHWAWLLEQHDLRSDAVIAGDSREWRALHKELKITRKVRGIILAAELAAVLIAVALLAAYAPRWSWWLAGSVALLLLARSGRPDGHRIISPAIIPPQYEEPTPDSITDALGSLGIPGINQVLKASPGHNFCITPVMRDGPGWGVQLDLPKGVTAEMIMSRRRELASGLRRPLSATWPEGVPAEHEARLSLWVGFHDITRAKPPKYPLAKAGQADVFAGLPFGTDPRQRAVSAPMFEVNWLIGAAPGQGKTAAVRALACGVALDPLADMWIHELAGKGDLEPLAQVCHRYVSGLDDESIAYAAESAALLRRELERRSKLFSQVPKQARPEGKVTRELAQAVRGLRPLVAIFDEVQNLFMHPEHGGQAGEDLAYVIRLGRALGVIAVLATQRPDKDSLPTAVRGIVTARFCLKVPDYDSNDMILGTGAYKAGYNAAIFRAKTDAGLGWLKGDGDPQVIRTYYLDLPASEKIAARAKVLRERAGVLSGYALGLEDETVARDVLADLLAVFGDDAGMHWAVAADRLAGRFPDRWADATGEGVSAQCRAVGVKSVDVRMDGSSPLKGCRRVAVEKAAVER